MTVNKYQPHVLVLPEDDATRQLANGFVLEVQHSRRIQVLPEAGGWTHVRDDFLTNLTKSMQNFEERRVVLLLDLDDRPNRRIEINSSIPPDLKDKVFLLGVSSEPERLRQAGLGSYESIGRQLAGECRNEVWELWKHELLRNNLGELSRLATSVRPFLF